MIYDNQKEINASPGRKVYNTSGYFTSMNLEFILNYNHEDEEKMTEFLELTVNFKHIYNCGKEREVKKNPPEPYTTSTLQQAASNELRLSPKATMALCQKLYEEGYITYMRTDSKTYSKDFINSVKIESTNGFTLGLEMIVKAKLNKRPIGEIPTIWIDRAHGESKFNLKKFLPSYCYWVFRLVFRRK